MKATKTGKRKKGEINVLYNPFALQVTGYRLQVQKKPWLYNPWIYGLDGFFEYPYFQKFQLSKPFTTLLFLVTPYPLPLT